MVSIDEDEDKVHSLDLSHIKNKFVELKARKKLSQISEDIEEYWEENSGGVLSLRKRGSSKIHKKKSSDDVLNFKKDDSKLLGEAPT